MKVQVLADTVVSQIAAGEVVERPSSVVRELVDNAIDAGAQRLEVEVEGGGRSLLSVTDDGCGMERDDAILAFERHATSKLVASEDLHVLTTRGFRGEALPSIASVARVRLLTRPSSAATATEVLFEGGTLKSVRPQPAPLGTRVEVRQLFFNTPARKKFLKSDKVEEGRIRSWLLRSSLATPHLRISLAIDGVQSIALPPRPSMLERGHTIFKGSTLPFEERNGPITCVGLVGHPALAQTEAESFVVIVNGRLVTDRLILRAVKEGFHSTLKEREFPIGFVALELPPKEVDVNVHPQKSEVRFSNPQAVFATVQEAVRRAVGGFSRPFWGSPKSRPFGDTPPSDEGAHPQWEAPSPAGGEVVGGNLAVRRDPAPPPPTLKFLAPIAPPEVVTRVAPPPSVFPYRELRYVGQILRCYLVCEYQEQLYVIDMHAAHERVNYNKIRAELERREKVSQGLLIPVVVDLAAHLSGGIDGKVALLQEAGFDAEPFGDASVIVRAVPHFLATDSVAVVVKEIASGGAAAGRERLDYIAARLACHASIRAGYRLEREEAYALFAALEEAELASACPHGRPVIVSFRSDEVERWFGRDR